jgi:hypothetical protein
LSGGLLDSGSLRRLAQGEISAVLFERERFVVQILLGDDGGIKHRGSVGSILL